MSRFWPWGISLAEVELGPRRNSLSCQLTLLVNFVSFCHHRLWPPTLTHNMRVTLLTARWSHRRLTWLILLGVLLTHLVLTLASITPAVYETDEYIRLQPELSIHTSKLTTRTILAYITPWNPHGMSMVDQFAEKLDLVSPVWYTVLVSRDSVSSGRDNATYVLSGGPPSKKEESWLKDKQKPGSRLKFVPRFYLDGWEQKDYADLLSNQENWQRLAQVVTGEVQKRGYDGVVFESAATHLLFEPISTLGSSLKKLSPDKSLIVVLPPLRTRYSMGTKLDRMQESQNRMIVQSIPQLAEVVDYFSIMTYDMSGAGGRSSAMEGKDFPNDSPLRNAKKGSLREAGPNTSAKWIAENIDMIVEATRAASHVKAQKRRKQRQADAKAEDEAIMREAHVEDDEMQRFKDPSNPLRYDDFAADEVLDEASVESDAAASERVPKQQETVEAETQSDPLLLIRGKLLMGMPMYGYRYPLFWIDKSTGQGIGVAPPSNPDEAKELFSRTSSSSLLPLLRGPAEAVTIDAIITILTDHDGVILDAKDTGEGWFDYVETVTRESAKGKGAHGVRPGDQIYWRLYLPLPTTTKTRLEALQGGNDEVRAGVSLWELGQANALLLHAF